MGRRSLGELVTMTFPRPTESDAHPEALTSLRHRYSERYMLTYFITFRLPSTSGTTAVRKVLHPTSLSGKIVLTVIEKQRLGKVFSMASS